MVPYFLERIMIGMNSISAGLFLSCFSLTALAGNHDPKAIVPLLANSKLTLIQGIKIAEQNSGPAVSAKFEVGDDGALALSVYNIPEGLQVEPEKATLSEVSMDPTQASPKLAVEVFADKEHIARAAAHMTLLKQSKISLVSLLEMTAMKTEATPIDIRNPTVVNNKPVADVVMFDKNLRPFTVNIDLLTGAIEQDSRNTSLLKKRN
jgi:hypothetical protein